MSTPPRTKDNSAPDQRLLVLLAVGVAICLFRVLPGSSWIGKKGEGREPATAAGYYWLVTGEGLTGGLYRINSAWLADPVNASSHGLDGLTLPAGPGMPPVKAFQLKTGNPPAHTEPPPGLAPFFFAPIAVNRADRELLMTLPGIGPRLADGIIALRQKKNSLNALHELLEVNGIGKARLASLNGLITLD
jgi:hypothetical protein